MTKSSGFSRPHPGQMKAQAARTARVRAIHLDIVRRHGLDPAQGLLPTVAAAPEARATLGLRVPAEAPDLPSAPLDAPGEPR